jgi:uncharacterized membrane protein
MSNVGHFNSTIPTPKAQMNPNTSGLEIHSLSDAPWYVLLHLACALLAVVLGASMLLRRKGDFSHKAMGWSWVCLMGTIAVTSFFIQARGSFSLIHVFSVVVLIMVPLAIISIRRKRVKAHRYTMSAMYAGLVIAGAFTLLPYRMLGQLMFAAR